MITSEEVNAVNEAAEKPAAAETIEPVVEDADEKDAASDVVEEIIEQKDIEVATTQASMGDAHSHEKVFLFYQRHRNFYL